MGNRLTAISIMFLGVCVLVGSWLLSDSLKANAKSSVASVTNHQLLTENELAQYLGISDSDLKKFIQINGSTITSPFPFMKIDNKYYFSLPAINNWLKTDPTGIYH